MWKTYFVLQFVCLFVSFRRHLLLWFLFFHCCDTTSLRLRDQWETLFTSILVNRRRILHGFVTCFKEGFFMHILSWCMFVAWYLFKFCCLNYTSWFKISTRLLGAEQNTDLRVLLALQNAIGVLLCNWTRLGCKLDRSRTWPNSRNSFIFLCFGFLPSSILLISLRIQNLA